MFKLLYLIDVFNTIKIILALTSAILLFIIAVNAGTLYEINSTPLKEIKKMKTLFTLLMLSVTLLIFTPSEKAMYGYMVDKYATKENYDIVKKELRDNIDYLLKKIGK